MTRRTYVLPTVRFVNVWAKELLIKSRQEKYYVKILWIFTFGANHDLHDVKRNKTTIKVV